MIKKFISDAKDRLTYNQWMSNDDISVYLRKSKRYINGNKYIMLDIANVTVNENKRRRGIFTDFLAQAVLLNPWDGVYIENVFDQRLGKFLVKQGFTCVCTGSPYGVNTPCYYLLKVEKT